jgi:hypothetical protein
LGCELDNDLTGECVEEEGRSWEFRGESVSSSSDDVEEETPPDEDDGASADSSD